MTNQPPRQHPDPRPAEPSSGTDDPILARYRSNTISHEDWLAALEAERPDVIDALVDAREVGDVSLVRELGARLVWGWVSAGNAEVDGVLLSFDDLSLDDDLLLRYLEDSVPARRLKALENGDAWTERERALAHVRAAEDFFGSTEEPHRCFQIVRVESRDGTPLFVAHILVGDYPCESCFAGAADSIDAAMEAVKALGYVSADDVRERYPAKQAWPRAAAVSFARIEKEERIRASRRAPNDVETPAVSRPILWLVYKVDAERGALFAFAEAAVRSHAIQCALSEACTWGDFRRLLPAGEWVDLEECLADDEDDDCHPWEDDLAWFDRALVSEVMGSNYGTWAADGNWWLPKAILAEQGQRRPFPVRDWNWFIDGPRADAVAEALRGLGYRVERADFLLG